MLESLASSLIFLAKAMGNFSYKHKSHFLYPQIYGYAFIAISQMTQ